MYKEYRREDYDRICDEWKAEFESKYGGLEEYHECMEFLGLNLDPSESQEEDTQKLKTATFAELCEEVESLTRNEMEDYAREIKEPDLEPDLEEEPKPKQSYAKMLEVRHAVTHEFYRLIDQPSADENTFDQAAKCIGMLLEWSDTDEHSELSAMLEKRRKEYLDEKSSRESKLSAELEAIRREIIDRTIDK